MAKLRHFSLVRGVGSPGPAREAVRYSCLREMQPDLNSSINSNREEVVLLFPMHLARHAIFGRWGIAPHLVVLDLYHKIEQRGIVTASQD